MLGISSKSFLINLILLSEEVVAHYLEDKSRELPLQEPFLKKPRILLLDEATSALDKVNEGIV